MSDLLQPVLAIAFVFLLLAVVVHRYGRASTGFPNWRGRLPSLESGSRIRLTPQHTVHVVRAEGFRWLLACHPAGVSVLAQAEEAADTSHQTEQCKGAKA
jgi:hypothetical protein